MLEKGKRFFHHLVEILLTKTVTYLSSYQEENLTTERPYPDFYVPGNAQNIHKKIDPNKKGKEYEFEKHTNDLEIKSITVITTIKPLVTQGTNQSYSLRDIQTRIKEPQRNRSRRCNVHDNPPESLDSTEQDMNEMARVDDDYVYMRHSNGEIPTFPFNDTLGAPVEK